MQPPQALPTTIATTGYQQATDLLTLFWNCLTYLVGFVLVCLGASGLADRFDGQFAPGATANAMERMLYLMIGAWLIFAARFDDYLRRIVAAIKAQK